MVDTVTSGIFPGANQSIAANSGVIPQQPEEDAQTQLIDNFDTFLELLVAQLQNQNPTDPIETESFTQQLTQFSELEQSIASNDNLEEILSSIQSQNAANVVSYIGATVNADGNTTTLANGQAVFNLQANEFVPDAQIEIRDALGGLVFQTTQELQQGANTFIFNGEGDQGQQFQDGSNFTISVNGTNSAGSFSPISTGISGVVDGIDFSTETPNLLIGTVRVPITAVNSVNQTL